jgi:hypothetical protein
VKQDLMKHFLFAKYCSRRDKKPDASTCKMTKKFRLRHPDEYKSKLLEIQGNKLPSIHRFFHHLNQAPSKPSPDSILVTYQI